MSHPRYILRHAAGAVKRRERRTSQGVALESMGRWILACAQLDDMKVRQGRPGLGPGVWMDGAQVVSE